MLSDILCSRFLSTLPVQFVLWTISGMTSIVVIAPSIGENKCMINFSIQFRSTAVRWSGQLSSFIERFQNLNR